MQVGFNADLLTFLCQEKKRAVPSVCYIKHILWWEHLYSFPLCFTFPKSCFESHSSLKSRWFKSQMLLSHLGIAEQAVNHILCKLSTHEVVTQTFNIIKTYLKIFIVHISSGLCIIFEDPKRCFKTLSLALFPLNVVQVYCLTVERAHRVKCQIFFDPLTSKNLYHISLSL